MKIKHGHSSNYTRTPEYMAWSNMKRRCFNDKTESYPLYGGRGITIYAPWINNFELFFGHVGERPTAKHSLNRIDNGGNYEPGNVEWADITSQCNNKRNNVFVEIAGERLTIGQAAKKYNVYPAAIRDRLRRGLKGLGLIIKTKTRLLKAINGNSQGE